MSRSPDDGSYPTIVILVSVFARGGAERQALLLARELRNRFGLDAQVWALMFEGDYRPAFEAAGVPTRVLGFRRPRTLLHWLPAVQRVSRALKEAEVDILLPFTTWPNVAAGLAYRLGGVRLCIWGERHAGGERAPGIERLAARQFRQFVANSTAGVEFLKTVMKVPSDRIDLVPNGVEIPERPDGGAWRARLALQSNQLLVVKVANITSLKDHPTLIRSWRRLLAQWGEWPQPVLALAGLLGDRHDECRRLVEDYGLGESVRFLGSIADVPALIAASDVAVFSSANEGMPNGVLECMALGKPVVATDLPGVRDALGPGVEVVLAPAGDEVALAERLLAVLRDPDLRRRLGQANHARIASEFSVERMARRQLDVIERNYGSRIADTARDSHLSQAI